jgi:pre-mRNA-splicing factor CDC5/CEF1
MRRSKMSLPAPTMGERELESFVRGGATPSALELDARGGATGGLLGEYADESTRALELLSSARTPRAPEAANAVMQEARNVLAQRELSTPLVGGANVALGAGTGYGGVTPLSSHVATPNVLAGQGACSFFFFFFFVSSCSFFFFCFVSSAHSFFSLFFFFFFLLLTGRGAGATPMVSGDGGGATPMSVRSAASARSSASARGGFGAGGGATPLNDALAINRGAAAPPAPGAASASSSASDDSGSDAASLMRLNQWEKVQGDARAKRLDAGLASLPAPQFTYDVVVPELPAAAEGEVQRGVRALDAAESALLGAAARRAEEEAERKRRSAAVTRDLPRPLAINRAMLDVVEPAGAAKRSAAALDAQRRVQEEMVRLLRRDAALFPLKKGAVRARAAPLAAVSDVQRAGAEALVRAEAARSRPHASALLPEDDDALTAVWQRARAAQTFVRAPAPKTKAAKAKSKAGEWIDVATLGAGGALAVARAEFESVAALVAAQEKRRAKLEKKVTVRTAGYVKRATALLGEIRAQHDAAVEIATQQICFERLHANECAAIPIRVARASFEVAQLREREARLQSFYGELDREYTELVERG